MKYKNKYNANDYDIDKSTKGQKEYIDKTDAPFFAPESGNCWYCGNNIYAPIGWEYANQRKRVNIDSLECDVITGITIKEAKNTLVTGCPHCNHSYCE